MNCLINKSYLENKMKETTEQIKQIWKTEEDYVKYRSEINYYMGYRNALGDLIDLFITEKNYYGKIGSEG